MQSLILIRHGESEHHVNGLTGGWTDVELTACGREQARLAAMRLRHDIGGRMMPEIWSSDLKRAMSTSAALSDALKIPIKKHAALRELNNGIAAGLTETEARLLALPKTEPVLDWRHYPEAESWRQFYARAAGFMDGITAGRREYFYIIVSHRGTIVNIVNWWLGLPIDQLQRLRVSVDAAPAGITVLKVNKWQERTIERLNDTAHLYAAGMRDRIRPG